MKYYHVWPLLVLALAISSWKNKNYKFYIVQSGSMEPVAMIGDLAVIKTASEYKNGDVITFNTNEGRVVTHRIYEKDNQKSFITKGDANRLEDISKVNKEQILGKVIRIIPRAGLLANFIQSKFGLTIFFGLPFGVSLVKSILAIDE